VKNLMAFFCCLAVLCPLNTGVLLAQESGSGIDLSATISGEAVYSRDLAHAPRNGAPVTAGIRAVFYPEWKIGSHWAVSGAVQVNSLPYFHEDFSINENGFRTHILQGHLGYYRVWKNASLVIRAGQLQSAFGNFLLHYDDTQNPLFGTPAQYSYDHGGVTTLGLAGVEALGTMGKWDARAQLTNSSPANPRGLFDRDQYANWTGGAGYSVRQGFRAGISGYQGPYLDRQDPAYLHGEARPVDLRATAWGAAVERGRGHWNVTGEWQHFYLPHREIPSIRQTAAYADAKLVLHPRWYVAARAGFRHTDQNSGEETYEFVVGFRPASRQLIKAGYTLERSRAGDLQPTLGLQFTTTMHPFSIAWR
jgi:hypothetical protein